MSFSINPLTFAAQKIATKKEQNQFMGNLSTLLNQMCTVINTPASLAAILNGQGLLFNSALFYKSVSLGTVSTSQTVDCVNACGVAIEMLFTASVTLSLTHLALGVPVMIRVANSSAGPLTLAVAATQPGGAAYSGVFWKTNSAFTNMTATGLSIANGVSIVASGAAIPTTHWFLFQVAN
jgi:hypothetical protein